MPDVVKHAWTHRPRAQGGTDPIEIPASGIKWAKAFGADEMVDEETFYPCTFTELFSNDATAFEAANVTAGKADWIQINEPGYYTMEASVTHATSVFDNTQDLMLECSFASGGLVASITQNMGDADYVGVRFTQADQLLTGYEATAGLYTRIGFHWDPANPTSDLDAEDPLKVAMMISLAGGPSTLPLICNLFLQRIADSGYVDLSPA